MLATIFNVGKAIIREKGVQWSRPTEGSVVLETLTELVLPAILFVFYYRIVLATRGSFRCHGPSADAWTAQQLRESTFCGQRPKYLIRDNDSKYGVTFAWVAASTGIKILKTPVAAPNANAVCERFLGSIRRECLDHLFVLGQRHLYRVIKAYADYSNWSARIRLLISVFHCLQRPTPGDWIDPSSSAFFQF